MASNELILSNEEIAQRLLRLSVARDAPIDDPQMEVEQLRSALSELSTQIARDKTTSTETKTSEGMPSNSNGDDYRTFTMRPKKPSTYSGERRNGACEQWCLEVYDYIERCREFFRPKPTDQQEVYLASENLTGPAMAWWVSYRQQVVQGLIAEPMPANFHEFSKVLRTNYGDINDQFRRREKYESLRQTSSVRDFANALNDHRLFLIPKPSEFEALRRFQTGLRLEIRTELEKHYSHVTNLQEYIEKADHYDRSLYREHLLKQKDKSKAPYTGTIHSIEQKTGYQTNEGPGSKEWCRAKGACYKCREIGHRQADCPKRMIPAKTRSPPFESLGKINRLGCTLITLKGISYFAGIPQAISIMIDSGADRIYISRKVASKIGNVRTGLPISITTASGEVITSTETVTALVTIGTYRLAVQGVLVDLDSYDMILGLSWFRTANPQIDWARLSIYVRDQEGEHKLEVERSPRTIKYDNFDTMPIRSASKALKKQAEAALYFVRKVTLPREGKDMPNTPLPFRSVVAQYADCFRSELPDSLPPTREYQHSIKTGDALPVNKNAYPISFAQQEEQISQVQELLDRGLIRTSASPWGFPVLFVKKPEGKWRMCIDYRGLNAVTERNTYPLPRIQDCLDRIGNAKRISKLDLLSGFHQVRVDEADVPKTAFNTRQGKFEFLVMPFGLTNAPATFQTLMNTILQPFLDKFVVVYIDDIVVFSNSDEEHIQHLQLVLERLRSNHLFAKPSKCTIGATEVEFCGHVVGQGTLRTARSKTDIIKEWPVPTTVHDIRSFLGLASYYRRFVRNFATIAAPLSELLKEKDVELRSKRFRPIMWNAQCQLAFEKLKDALTSEPVLIQPDYQQPFTIETDASEWAIGCCLLQLGEDRILHPVAYDGRKLQGAELNYAVQEKELLAIKHALRTWSYYIDNHHRTKILTDHESLKYLKDTKVPSKRLAHWIAEFGTYDLDIQYRPGTNATVPDALSRRPDFIGKGEAYQAQFNSLRSIDEEEWEEAMINYLKNGTLPLNKKLEDTILRDKEYPATSFELENNSLLFKKTNEGRAPYIMPILRKPLLERTHHEYGHLGWPGLKTVFERRAWWPTLERDIQNQISLCPACQVAKGSNEKQTRGPRNILDRRDAQLFESWSIDLIGRLPRTYNGNRWIITAIERSSGWPVAEAVGDASSATVSRFLEKSIFAIYGVPNEILSDNGANLVGEELGQFLQSAGIKHRTTTPYHPQTNGKVERFNGILGGMITKYLYGKSVRMWDEYLSQSLFAIRIRTHAITKQSPFFLLYGMQPRLKNDAASSYEVKDAVERHEAANEARLKANHDLVQKAIKAGLVRDSNLKIKADIPVGTFVLVREEALLKFRPKWFGPYKVIMSAPIGTYALQDCHGQVVKSLIHGDRLTTINQSLVDPRTGQWRSIYNANKIRDQFHLIDASPQTRIELERDLIPGYTYKELATITKREWVDIQSKGLDRSKLGEGRKNENTYEEAIFQKLRTRVLLQEKRQEKEARAEEGEIPTSNEALVPIVRENANEMPVPLASESIEKDSERKGFRHRGVPNGGNSSARLRPQGNRRDQRISRSEEPVNERVVRDLQPRPRRYSNEKELAGQVTFDFQQEKARMLAEHHERRRQQGRKPRSEPERQENAPIIPTSNEVMGKQKRRPGRPRKHPIVVQKPPLDPLIIGRRKPGRPRKIKGNMPTHFERSIPRASKVKISNETIPVPKIRDGKSSYSLRTNPRPKRQRDPY